MAGEATQNFGETQQALNYAEAAAWRTFANVALGSKYVASSGAPGYFGLIRSTTGPVSNVPRYVVPNGMPRAGALVAGRQAVKNVLIRGGTATVVLQGGFYLGAGIGSLGVGAYRCLSGGGE